MKTLQLSQNKEAFIDDEDFERVSKFKWTYQRAHIGLDKNCEYAFTTTGGSHKTRKRIYLHRFISNAPKGKLVDHINGNGLDNRKDNIRFASHSQNQANVKPKTNKMYSNLKGVSFYKQCNKWMSTITVSGKRIYLGVFTTDVAAHEAYKNASIKHFGEFSLV